jgi:hypothetical protein
VRAIKLGFLSFIFLFLLITGFSLFIPSHITISRAVNIKGTKEKVMAEVSDPGKWVSWYPGLDSAQPVFVDGKVKGYSFDCSAANPVTILHTKTSNDEVLALFHPKKLRPVLNGWKVLSYPASDSITVQWYMDFHLRWYPWEKFSSLLLEKSHGAKMELGLTRLRQKIQTP